MKRISKDMGLYFVEESFDNFKTLRSLAVASTYEKALKILITGKGIIRRVKRGTYVIS